MKNKKDDHEGSEFTITVKTKNWGKSDRQSKGWQKPVGGILLSIGGSVLATAPMTHAAPAYLVGMAVFVILGTCLFVYGQFFQ